MSKILIIEDEAVIRSALHRLLERRGYRVTVAESVEQAERQGGLQGFDLIIADLRLPGEPGTAIMDRAPDVPVLIMTSYASVRSAVESIKRGAVDYIAKPFDHEELVLLVERTLKQHRMERQKNALKSDVDRAYPVEGMVGRCAAMQQVFERIAKVAPTDSTVLILGESGTGKELVARAIHEHSPRSDAPIVAVNCASIPDTLIESELFGHEKGAFTGADRPRAGLVESADGGTLFLDEIGELPLAAQAQLLRVLQDGEIRRVGSERSRRVDVRLIAATHRDLKQLVQDNLFRSDLYFRLRVVELALPPLRERGADLIELARFLLEKACTRLNRPRLELTRETLDAVTAYAWPGNVRELENAIERAVILCDGEEITPELLAIDQPPESESAAGAAAPAGVSLEDYFRRFVTENQDRMTETELARRLGISRKTLWERRQRLGLTRTPKR
ncbi:MAG: sigma-54 dependent transcriptional regulator [Chromatiales bacterium]|jgi:DNA-binding NtrC family response regulator